MSDIEPRPALKRFSVIQEIVLRANDYKGGWEHCSREWLFSKLLDEVGELSRAMRIAPSCGLAEHVAVEAADIANFAMMICDNAFDEKSKDEAIKELVDKRLRELDKK